MDPIDFGDITDLRIRLQVLTEEADRRLVTVFGSGISSEVLPNVAELTQLFREHVPSRGLARFDETINGITDPGLKYQAAASVLTHQAGEHTVMRAIRTAVLRACADVPAQDVATAARDEEQCREYVKSGSWKIPRGYRRFARFFAALSGKVRGPIITTNFDPLIEVALNEAGIPAVPYPVATDSAPTLDQLQEFIAQPVLHIHGYWTGPATSNVPSRITADRPKLDDALNALLTNSVVLVVGYSGWLDGFMKSLRSRVLNEADLLQSVVLWAAYEKQPADAVGDGVLAQLMGAPGFSLYLGVDGHELFTDDLDRNDDEAQAASSPYGYTRVLRQVTATGYSPGPFAEGRQPDWADAEPGRWPMLGSTATLERELTQQLDSGGGGGVVAIGPLGEGKSLAARQVAIQVAEGRPDWNVLWREPGAPPITDAWLRDLQATSDRTLVCIDEADLIADELVATQGIWGTESSGLAFLLASHDRLWWQGAGNSLQPYINDVLFHGITTDDAKKVAETWHELGLLPASQDAAAVAERLVSSAGVMAARSNTLFGAVLDVRYGRQLGSRVEDLLQKLREVKLTDDVSVGDVFAGICVMQNALDRDGNRGRGASRPVIAAMAGLDTVFADGKILKTLGREAAVTFAGSRVYSRHPAIAKTVVECLHREGRAEKIYKLVGMAGGALKVAGARAEDGFRDAYRLCNSLPVREAVWAATGAVEGTQALLEPRVTLLSTLRREAGDRSVRLARGLAPNIFDFPDYRGAIRAFLVDFSISMRDEGHAQTSAGLAALALDDRVGFTLDSKQAGYALVSLTQSTIKLNAQKAGGLATGAPEISYVLLELIRGEEETVRYLRHVHTDLGDVADFRQLSVAKLCSQLAALLHGVAKSASNETGVPIELDNFLSIDSLRQLAERGRR
jgi:hypothetical protein